MEVFLNHLALERSVSASSIQTQALNVHVPKRDMNDRKRCLCVHTHKQRYVYLAIMYNAHVELTVSPVNAGHLVGAVSWCYT